MKFFITLRPLHSILNDLAVLVCFRPYFLNLLPSLDLFGYLNQLRVPQQVT